MDDTFKYTELKHAGGEMPALIPCPFCGGEADTLYNWGATVSAFCKKCGASTSYFETEALAIAAWNTRADRWIPVTERLPKKNVMVLVSGKDWHNEPVVVARQLTDHGWYDAGDEYSTRFVTHWMPLPLPPEAA